MYAKQALKPTSSRTAARALSARHPSRCAACRSADGPDLGTDTASCSWLASRLSAAGIEPTAQRRSIGAMLLCGPVHVTAEQVLGAIQAQGLPVSRATVYNTLRLFAGRGLLRELSIKGMDMVYDSTTAPHHHFHDLDSGELSDIDSAALRVSGLDAAGAGWDIDAVEVVVRGRRRPAVA